MGPASSYTYRVFDGHHCIGHGCFKIGVTPEKMRRLHGHATVRLEVCAAMEVGCDQIVEERDNGEQWMRMSRGRMWINGGWEKLS
jgi:hypothetical protein